MKTRPFAAACALVALILTAAPAFSADPPKPVPFEHPYNLVASRILPKALLKGPHHRVEEAVASDGYMNTYTVRSRYGTYRIVSTALLATRVDEFAAMAAMDKAGGAKEYGKGVLEGGAQFVQGVANLVAHPVDTVQGAASGVGKLFARADESMTGANPSKYEDSAGARLTGFAATRRAQALAYGVDPYSTNERLREKLESLSTAGYAGEMTTTGLKLLIPGGVGIAVSSVGGVNWLNQVDLSKPPVDLRMENRDTLLSLGAGESAVWAFIDNQEYTPTQQSFIVKSLAELGRPGGLTTFLRLASRTENQDQALFRQRMAMMYSGYHRKVERLRGFIRMGNLVGALSEKGRLVLCFPLDHMCWTPEVGRLASGMESAMETFRPQAMELWVTGTASPTARKALTDRGWVVREKAGKQLLGETF
ncbi:MAG: hypothetical protein ACOZEN_13020 [Thermodesulfobacteriota bacterium]